MVMGVLVMVKVLPPILVLDRENSVSEPSLRVLIQVTLGRGRPSAVQLRERGDGLSSSTLLTGLTRIVGATVVIEKNSSATVLA